MEANYNKIMGIERSKKRAKTKARMVGKLNLVMKNDDNDEFEQEGSDSSQEDTSETDDEDNENEVEDR